MKYVIIGNSAAGIGAVERIRQTDRQGEIIIITNEPHHTYSRPLISYFLRKTITKEKMKYRGDSFYADNNVDVIHASATGIDEKNKQVILSDNSRVSYDKLLAATGSSALVPPFQGIDNVKNKFTFISLDDAQKIEMNLGGDKSVLIIGAGLIGLKCAEGILNRVSQITVIDLAPRILSSVLDEAGAKIIQKHLESNGIEFMLSTGVKRFEEHAAILENGDKIDFDLLVFAVGVRPNISLLDGIAKIDRGIVINKKSETTSPNIYAAGDCTQTVDVSSGQNKIMALLPNAYMQGECAGINMAGGVKSFDKAIPMNAIGLCGRHIITAGNYTGGVYSETADGIYKRLFYSDNKLNGYILIGNVEKAGIYTNLIRERTPLDSIDFALVCKSPGLMAFAKEDRKVKLGGKVG